MGKIKVMLNTDNYLRDVSDLTESEIRELPEYRLVEYVWIEVEMNERM